MPDLIHFKTQTSQTNILNKPVGDQISAPSPNFIAMVGANICAIQAELKPILAQISLPWQQGSAAQHFVWFH